MLTAVSETQPITAQELILRLAELAVKLGDLPCTMQSAYGAGPDLWARSDYRRQVLAADAQEYARWVPAEDLSRLRPEADVYRKFSDFVQMQPPQAGALQSVCSFSATQVSEIAEANGSGDSRISARQAILASSLLLFMQFIFERHIDASQAPVNWLIEMRDLHQAIFA